MSAGRFSVKDVRAALADLDNWLSIIEDLHATGTPAGDVVNGFTKAAAKRLVRVASPLFQTLVEELDNE